MNIVENSDIRERIRQGWELWLEVPYPTDDYPPGSAEADIDGIDLALLDGDAAAAVAWFIDPALEGRGDPGLREITRRHALSALERIVPRLSEDGKAYFGQLLGLLRLVDQATEQ